MAYPRTRPPGAARAEPPSAPVRAGAGRTGRQTAEDGVAPLPVTTIVAIAAASVTARRTQTPQTRPDAAPAPLGSRAA
ncbi:hypothetical protein WMF04_02020 [Sorangium sp. So ce260]|uniref:hypothetical protein n=1 Tax=Sorangium sp. So ce260 TaxID=3133291 RepID=UPI003F607319